MPNIASGTAAGLIKRYNPKARKSETTDKSIGKIVAAFQFEG